MSERRRSRDAKRVQEPYADLASDLFAQFPEFHSWYVERHSDKDKDDPYWWQNPWTVVGGAGFSTFFNRILRDGVDEDLIGRCLSWVEDRARDDSTEDLVEVAFLENLGDCEDMFEADFDTTMTDDAYRNQITALRDRARLLLGPCSLELLGKNEARWKRVKESIASARAANPTYKTASEVMLDHLVALSREKANESDQEMNP